MTSSASLIREQLIAWASRLDGLPPNVTAHPPEPGDKLPLPTLACWFTKEEAIGLGRRILSQTADGDTIDYWGDREADVVLHWRVASSADADLVRDGFLGAALYSATDKSAVESIVLPLRISVAGEDRTGKLYFTGESRLADPEATQVRGLWVVQHMARLTYPHITSRSGGPYGRMAISVAVAGKTYHLSSGADPIQPAADLDA